MISRLFGPTTGIAILAMLVSSLVTSTAYADGPEYTYIGISYQWTDVKYATNPNVDERYNNGTLEGENIDFSLGILPWLHVAGQAFGYLDGTCKNCNTNVDGSFYDADIKAYKAGIGVNLGLDMIGLNADTDFIIRANYINTKMKTLNVTSPTSIDDNGYSIEGMINSQISDRADVFVGYEYYDMDKTSNSDVTIGLNYRVWKGLSVFSRGIIFDSESGFELGARGFFGGLIFNDRDSIFK
jgi:hypothetical protein